MKGMRLFLLEDDPRRIAAFRKAHGDEGGTIFVALLADDAIREIETGELYDEYHLDHNLDIEHYSQAHCDKITCGCAVARNLANRLNDHSGPQPLVVIHSWNPQGADKMWAQFNRLGLACKRKRFAL